MRYDDKCQAAAFVIDDMVKDGSSQDQIEFAIMRKFGLGKKFVIDQLELLDRVSKPKRRKRK